MESIEHGGEWEFRYCTSARGQVFKYTKFWAYVAAQSDGRFSRWDDRAAAWVELDAATLEEAQAVALTIARLGG